MGKQPDTQYWHPIAQSMDVEDSKLRLYVRHKHSLGVGRESILRGVLISQTPEPYRVKTGFVAHLGEELLTSDQCDILVYSPTISQPFYRIDEFVVVPYYAARIAIEVRSRLTIELAKEGKRSNRTISGLDQMFKVWKSMRQFPIPRPVFGFAYTGVKFEDFVAGVARRVDGDILNVPECIAVHKKNYICLRVTERLVKPNPPPPDPKVCISIDLSQSQVGRSEGLATACFLGLYNGQVRKDSVPDFAWRNPVPEFTIEGIRNLAGNLKIPDSAIRIIDEKGQISQGPISI